MESNKYSQKTSCHFLTSLTSGQYIYIYSSLSLSLLLCCILLQGTTERQGQVGVVSLRQAWLPTLAEFGRQALLPKLSEFGPRPQEPDGSQPHVTCNISKQRYVAVIVIRKMLRHCRVCVWVCVCVCVCLCVCVCVCEYHLYRCKTSAYCRGATAHLPMLPNEAMEDVVEGFMGA